MELKKSKTGTMVKKILLYGTFALVLTVVFSMFAALLVVNETVSMQYVKILTTAIHGASVLIVVLASLRKDSSQKLLVAFGIAAVYYVLMLLMKMACFPNETANVLSGSIVIFSAAALSATIRSLSKNKHTYKPAKKR